MMQNAIWNDGAELPKFPSLEGEIKTDVLIIGGGMCGILCAYFLEWAGVDYTLVEAGRIGQGITGSTSAKITAQHGLLYSGLIKNLGREQAQLYLEANQQAVERYTQLCQNRECGFERKTSYTYSRNDRQSVENEIRAIQLLGGSAEFAEHLRLPFRTSGAVKLRCQGQFHPLQLIAALARGLHIYEKTKIFDVKPQLAETEHGSIKANKIIVATHFPFVGRYGGYFAKLCQYRSYIVAVCNAPNVDGIYTEASERGLSFRNEQKLLLLEGGGHRTGKNGGGWEELRLAAKRYYPNAQEAAAWTGQDCMTPDRIPYIGQYSKRTPWLYVASGFNRWGMTSAMTAALLLRDLILERENEFAPLFSPQRTLLTPQMIVNGFESVSNRILPHVKKCAHLGGTLLWNPAEHSWDSPYDQAQAKNAKRSE